MEFMYRAGDQRRRSPSPPSPSPARTAPGASAGGQPAVGADADETRRQAEKARIRERILREETVDRFALELEVRHDLIIEGFRQMSELTPVRVMEANLSSLLFASKVSKDSALAASLAKRKSPIHGAASNVAVETSSKKLKLSLTCTVCGITPNSEKALQDHLNGKGHKRKAEALAAQPTSAPESEPEVEEADEEEDAWSTAPSGDFKPTKFTMVTNKGTLNQLTQMDGYLLCEVCNVRTADRVTMMCHLEGTKHISKATRRSTSEATAGTLTRKHMNKHAVPTAVADTVVLEVDGERHTVRREGGVLLCERCAVKTPSESGMRSHLSGKKHKNQANGAISVASVNGANGVEKEVAIDKGTAIVDKTASQMEPPVTKPMEENASNSSSELKGTVATSAEKDVSAMESSKVPGVEAAKVSTGPLSAVVKTVGDSDSDLVMEVDGVRHPLRLVEGFLLCPCCDVKAASDIVMRSHLIGKKHKNKMKSAEAGVGGKGAFDAATSGQEQGNVQKMSRAGGDVGSEAPTTKNAAAAVAHAEIDAPQAEVEAVTTPTEPADGITEPAGKPFKIQVEGKLFTVLQVNDTFSCEPCGVRGCNKDTMVKHLYTSTHWEKASLMEKEEQLPRAAAEELVMEGNDSSPAGEGAAQVKG